MNIYLKIFRDKITNMDSGSKEEIKTSVEYTNGQTDSDMIVS